MYEFSTFILLALMFNTQIAIAPDSACVNSTIKLHNSTSAQLHMANINSTHMKSMSKKK